MRYYNYTIYQSVLAVKLLCWLEWKTNQYCSLRCMAIVQSKTYTLQLALNTRTILIQSTFWADNLLSTHSRYNPPKQYSWDCTADIPNQTSSTYDKSCFTSHSVITWTWFVYELRNIRFIQNLFKATPGQFRVIRLERSEWIIKTETILNIPEQCSCPITHYQIVVFLFFHIKLLCTSPFNIRLRSQYFGIRLGLLSANVFEDTPLEVSFNWFSLWKLLV